MKKILITILQVICFIFSYEILATIYYFICDILLKIIEKLPKFIVIIFSNYFAEAIFYTFVPFLFGVILVMIMGFIFKKYLLNIFSYFAILTYSVYLHVSNIVQVISDKGIVTWNTANSIWSAVIFVGITSYLLLEMCDFKIIKKSIE